MVREDQWYENASAAKYRVSLDLYPSINVGPDAASTRLTTSLASHTLCAKIKKAEGSGDCAYNDLSPWNAIVYTKPGHMHHVRLPQISCSI